MSLKKREFCLEVGFFLLRRTMAFIEETKDNACIKEDCIRRVLKAEATIARTTHLEIRYRTGSSALSRLFL